MSLHTITSAAGRVQKGAKGLRSFDRWWDSGGEWVEPANKRRGGESGVRILRSLNDERPDLYCKRQIGHIYRSLQHPMGLPTVLRERKAYLAYARLGIRTPNIVYCGARRSDGNWQALLVTEALRGFVSLQDWYRVQGETHVAQHLMAALGTELARLHKGRWQHGCLYPKHIFVKTLTNTLGGVQVEVALLDLEKSRQRWSVGKASRKDLSQLRRHWGELPKDDLLALEGSYQLALRGAL
ncbi:MULTISPECIES: lipopolysaccharide kinase InaA family protein [Pseudomonadaceae]|uniref:LPS kinase n=2 Tax=Pseudomonadaceae TaxID=135621 RepID=A0A6J4DY17_9PSED|nr:MULTISPECIES: lipopolysaccharide kinase InaA family protein [Pseudomonas]ELN4741136.1 hypothetical protein [Escherichia coli]MDH0895521.1 InaA protein [Pseudomonas sp. GD03875]MDH1065617.1 InaA protein [Pseudomonas sp. GD03985]MDN4143571.1 lipopolysaccharide kinase InaA family protein [Pseudomonas tohonis]SUD13090.1 lipopolysaccharide kinase [Pseudomonas alcaligenes]